MEGDIDEGSGSAILPGSELDFYLIQELLGYSYRGALLLSDAVGPLLLVESQPMVTEAERGGVAVNIDREDFCTIESRDNSWEEYLVTFSWSGGEVELRSGGSAQIPLPTHELALVLGRSEHASCVDSCDGDEWALWADVP